ncbi:conserved hypothetical protein [Vibrio chagasii]|nr:conserved hypothetical protein [Vibrio chagasii]
MSKSISGRKGKKSTSKELAILAINSLTLVTSIGCLVFAMNYRVPPEIIPVHKGGKYFEKTPLHLSNKEDKEVKQWVADTLIESFDFHYRNKDKHPSTLSDKYSPEALAYLDNFINDGLLSARVERESGIVELVLGDGFTIDKGQVGDLFGWQAKTKGALMLYHKGGRSRIARYEIIVTVTRADESVNVDGINISSLQMRKI